MAPFKRERSGLSRLDGLLFRASPLASYVDKVVLNNDLRWLHDHGYNIVNLECSRWSSGTAMYEDFKSKFNLGEYSGSNFLAAVTDAMYQVTIEPYTGLVLALHDFDACLSETMIGERDAKSLLDGLASRSRFHLLFGERFFVIIQCAVIPYRFKSFACLEIWPNPLESANRMRAKLGREPLQSIDWDDPARGPEIELTP